MKAAGLLAFVVACFLHPAATGKVSFLVAHTNATFFVSLVVALQAVIVTCDGWYAPIYFAEEDTDPGRHLPRSMIDSVAACIVSYLLVTAALFRIVPLSQLARSAIPAADAALAFFWRSRKTDHPDHLDGDSHQHHQRDAFDYATNAVCHEPRPPAAALGDLRERRRHSPALVLLLSTVATIALILGGGFETLIAIASVLYVLVYMSGFVALLVLRRSKPSLPQPYKVWCYPWSTLLVLAGSAVFFVAAVVGDLKNSLFALILAVCTYPLYPLVVRNRARRVSLKVAELRDPAV